MIQAQGNTPYRQKPIKKFSCYKINFKWDFSTTSLQPRTKPTSQSSKIGSPSELRIFYRLSLPRWPVTLYVILILGNPINPTVLTPVDNITLYFITSHFIKGFRSSLLSFSFFISTLVLLFHCRSNRISSLIGYSPRRPNALLI